MGTAHMTNLELKAITPNYIANVLGIYRQCEDFLALGPVSKASMDMVTADIEEANAESGVFCGIFHAKKMIGVVSYVPSRFEFRPVDAFILLLMITPPYRQKGIGGAVIDQVEKEICAKGRVRSILCGVQVNNPDAIRFWQKKGYKIVSGPQKRPDKTTVYNLRKDINR